jgi:hypothetical protein
MLEAIQETDFGNEGELQSWAFSNSTTFFGSSVLLSGF